MNGLRTQVLPISLIALVVASAWSPTAAAAPEVRLASESQVTVDGFVDTFTFSTGTSASAGVISLKAPNGSVMVFVQMQGGGNAQAPAQVWRLDGTQASGPSFWKAIGTLDGVPADGTWEWSISGWYESSDASPFYAPDVELFVAGKTIRAGYFIESPTFNNPQIWNWHRTNSTFQDDSPSAGSIPQQDSVVQGEEDPGSVRYYSGVTSIPAVRDLNNPDGSKTIYVDQDNDGQKDPSEPSVTTPVPSSSSGLTERPLLHEEDIGIESQPLPPVGTGGIPVPDVPPQPGQPVPDHPGAGPVVTPGVGQDVGVLSTRDSGANYCVYFTPEGDSEQEVTCVGRSFLGPLDPSMPRGDTPLVFYDPMDVPATGPIVTPDVPPTPGQTTPDVPPVPMGSLGNSPAVTADVDVSYSYDAGRLAPLVSVLGQQTWSPVAPGDAAWLASPTNAAALTVTVTVYKDGVSQGTVSQSIPALGQILAAAEMSAGTL